MNIGALTELRRFIRNPRLAASKNGILHLDPLNERTLIDWMYGGIKSEAEDVLARNQGSSASPDLFEVWLDPAALSSGYWLSTTGAPLIAEP